MSLDLLQHRTRPADGEPAGMIVLFHGRGADESDLYPLFNVFDPGRRLVGVTPRGPLSMPPGGAHWYVVHRVGYPDRTTFEPTFERASRWLDALVEANAMDYDRVVLGGFSQGAVMSYALGLGAGRPTPAGIAAFSGFVPTVDGFEFDLDRDLEVMIGHGELDPVISVEFGRAARDLLTGAGIPTKYKEYPLPHTIEPHFARDVGAWISRLLEVGDPEPR